MELPYPIRKRPSPYLLAILLVAFAAAVRIWPLHILDIKQAWLTFYPAVIFTALYGGLLPGFLTAMLSVLIICYGWPLLSAQPFIQDTADKVALFVFLFNSMLISVAGFFIIRYAQQKKKAVDQLKEANAKLRTINDHLPGSFIYQLQTNANGNLELSYLSNGVSAYSKLDVAEIGNNLQLLIETIVEEDRAAYYAARQYASQHNQTLNIDVRMTRVDGSTGWANIHSIPRIQDNGTVVWDGLFTDITKRKELEQQLTESEDFLNETGNLGKTGGWLLNARTLDAIWTAETYLMHELAEGSKVTMQTSLDFYHPNDYARIKALLQKALTLGEGFQTEAQKISATGRTFWVTLTCKPIIENGSIIALHGVLQDITERKMLEKELEQQQLYNQRLITEMVIQGYETEKSNIAFQLHEDINQLLVATKIHMEIAGKQHNDLETKLSLSTAYLNSAIEKINNLFDAVDAPVFTDIGFTQTLQALINDYRQHSSMQIVLICHQYNWNELPPKIMLLIYRIVSDRLQSIKLLQQAHRITIQLQVNNNLVQLSFNTQTKQNSLLIDVVNRDIQILESRLAFYNGSISITEPQPGTQHLHINLPLHLQ